MRIRSLLVLVAYCSGVAGAQAGAGVQPAAAGARLAGDTALWADTEVTTDQEPGLPPLPAPPGLGPPPPPPPLPEKTKVNLPGMTWASLKRLPDFTGVVWVPDDVPRKEKAYLRDVPLPPLKPEFLAAARAQVQAILDGKEPAPTSTCKFDGMPRAGLYPYPIQFLYRAGSVTVQANGVPRSVNVDGHPLHRDPNDIAELSIWGDASAQWQGGTLVIQTAYVREDIDTFYGVPNDPQMRLTERYRLLGPGKLERVVTLEAPAYLERPWSWRTTYSRGGTPSWATRFCLPRELPDRSTREVGARRPWPENARFTPETSADEAAALTDRWGTGWLSPWSWDGRVVYVDKMSIVPPLKPAPLKASQQFIRRAADGRAEFKFGLCYPNGVPRSAWYAYPPKFNFLPGGILLITVVGETREIFLDGRPHPAKIDPADTSTAYLGHSIGWWEGDTLVIDTIGFSPDHELYYDVPNGGSLHVVERYRISTDGETLALLLKIEDPAKLTIPWVLRRKYSRHSAAPGAISSQDLAIDPEICRPAASGREKVGAGGQTFIDLTPPKPGLGIGKKD